MDHTKWMKMAKSWRKRKLTNKKEMKAVVEIHKIFGYQTSRKIVLDKRAWALTVLQKETDLYHKISKIQPIDRIPVGLEEVITLIQKEVQNKEMNILSNINNPRTIITHLNSFYQSLKLLSWKTHFYHQIIKFTNFTIPKTLLKYSKKKDN